MRATGLVVMASYNLDGVSSMNAICTARKASMQCSCRRGFCLCSVSAGSVAVAVVGHVVGRVTGEDIALAKLSALKASRAERRDKATAVKLQAEEEEQWHTAQIDLIEQIEAEIRESGAAAGDVLLSSGVGGADSVGVDGPVVKPGVTIAEIWGSGYKFYEPDDKENPEYDVRVLVGKRTNRERAMAVARVYGKRLRESSLADVILRTGDTAAVDVASIRGSLGGLVRYGGEWKRERGWLVYRGTSLEPDKPWILQLTEERNELRRRERKVANLSI